MSTPEQRRETAYGKICAEKCQWCAKGSTKITHYVGSPSIHDGWVNRICTAPTRDTVIADLAREVDRYERAVEAAIKTIEGLADQQEMPDDSYMPTLAMLADLAAGKDGK
jgi:hypothetical protein